MNRSRSWMRLFFGVAMLWIGLSGPSLAQFPTVKATIDGIPSGGSVQMSQNSGSSYVNVSYAGSIHAARNTPDGGTFTGSLLLGDAPGGRGFLTFCTERNQTIGYASYTFDVRDLQYASDPDIGVTKANQMRQLLYHVYPVFGQPLTAQQGLAIQIAIWEIEREPGTGPYVLSGSGAGVIRYQSDSPSGAIALAQGWLNSYVNDKPLTSFAHGLWALIPGNNQDLLAQEAPASNTLCRKVHLYSNGPVGTVGPLLGTASFTAVRRTDGRFNLTLRTDEGIFNGNGLVYNDGHFPLSSGPPCQSTFEQCLPYQSPSPFVATLGTFTWGSGDFDLDTLVVSRSAGGSGDRITFGPNGTYTYTGAHFPSHTGTYRMMDCANAVPVPGTLALMLIPLAGFALAARRRHRADSQSGVPL